ncbi:MAG: ABC-F family ATP-binding cassette domain-containing protein [Termitinemataceae bacterium]|nr:MAG: ABC-F family ATP-binding cassette domain-containing protein [Termitinemataceae bacterium]
MAFIQFTDVSIAFGNRDIVRGAHFFMKNGTHAALCGANGSGKTTFMKVLAGIIIPDNGERAIEKGARISYLPQSGIVHAGRTLRDEAELAFSHIKVLEDRATDIRTELEASSSDDEKTLALLSELHILTESIENSGYNMRAKNISACFLGLGFENSDLDRSCTEFSGGWQMRIALAKVILEAPDIILLDEPTNYLDIEARTWLIKWLKGFSGAYLLVSHDKFFLDSTVNEIYEIFSSRLKRYSGNYSKYEAVRDSEIEALLEAYRLQQEEIAKSEDLIRRFRYKATKAAMVQERIKKLEKMELVEIPETLKKMAITLPTPPHSGKIALNVENISKSYGQKMVLTGLNILVESGEKLLVAGRNGAGKSTLLRIIAGVDTDFSGSVGLGAGIQVAYFSQDAAETISGTQTILEFLEEDCPTALIPRIRDMLGAFLFRGDDVFKSINVLSGGEKSRLALLKILLRPINLLILDEPTNHLDINSKDILLEALKKFTGTVIFVSHDRYFMDALSKQTLELRCGKPSRIFLGNYSYYEAKITNDDGETSNIITAENKNVDTTNVLHSTSKLTKDISRSNITLSAKEQREIDKQRQAEMRRIKNLETDLIDQIDSLEAEKTAVEAELANPEIYSNGDKVRRHKDKLRTMELRIAELIAQWEKLNVSNRNPLKSK